ncbi:MAG: BatA domain-containing protein [Planctomycetaceae bacterium]|nr:BatA domain-containing protein [Planctomycetaceae bacterium]
MDLLAPIFAVAGIAAAVGPFALHMLRRAPTQQMPFSLVRFLKVSRPKLTRRSTLEHWPLMLLRILALLLIGLAFARPFLRTVTSQDRPDAELQSVTILIDKSASMRRDGIRESVVQKVRDVISDLGPQDVLSIAEFSNHVTTQISREQWHTTGSGERTALVEKVLEAYEPDWMPTKTGRALRTTAEELLQESSEFGRMTSRRIVLITDFQRGSDLDELKSGEWPAGVAVDLHIVSPQKRGNVGITFVADRRADRSRVRISSAGDTEEQNYRLQPYAADGSPIGAAIPITVAPGQRRSVLLPAADKDLQAAVAGVELIGDPHPFDNVADLPETEEPIADIAHIGSADVNDPESMRYYLQRAFDGNEERSVLISDLAPGDNVLRPVPGDVSLLAATQAVPANLLPSVRKFLENGGTMLMAAPDVAAVTSIREFLPEITDVAEADVNDYAMLSRIDFSHPLFVQFAEGKFSDFSSVRFWKYRRVDLQPTSEPQTATDQDRSRYTIAARFDSGLPAIVDFHPMVGGRILLLTAGWHPTDSQWALSSRFAPMLSRVLNLADPVTREHVVLTVADQIFPRDLVGTENWAVRFPDGTTMSADDVAEANAESLQAADLRPTADNDPPATDPADTFGAKSAPASRTGEIVLNQPGRYVITGDTAEGEHNVHLIAGLAAAESRTEPLPPGQLEVLGIGVKTSQDSNHTETIPVETNLSPEQLSSRELELQQKWWRWFLVSGLTCLIAESIWAAAIHRRQIAESV